MDILELDLAAGAGADIIASLERHQGQDLARIASLLERAFLLRSPWAPGLRFVGAQARARHATGESELMSFGGCALSLESAFASCLGEAAERLSQVERAGDARYTAPLTDVDGRGSEAVARFSRLVLAHSGRSDAENPEWLEGLSLGGKTTPVPADWCLRRSRAGPLKIPGAALSVGCAAGPSPGEARERALLELVERDAVSLWWDGGRPARAVLFDELAGAAQVLAALRASDQSRKTSLLDLTNDLQIPVIAAYATDRDDRNFVCGFAARPSLDAAASAALVEMCQLEVGLQLAILKQEQLGEAALSDDDRNHLLRAAQVNVTANPCFTTLEAVGVPPRPAARDMVNVQRTFERAGVEAVLVDLTRPEIGIPVIKAIAPALQLAPCAVQTARLQAELALHGPRSQSASLF